MKDMDKIGRGLSNIEHNKPQTAQLISKLISIYGCKMTISSQWAIRS